MMKGSRNPLNTSEKIERSFIVMKAALVIMAAGMGSRYGGSKQVDGIGPNGEF